MSLPTASNTSPVTPTPAVVPQDNARVAGFVDRRGSAGAESGRLERRQFGSSHAELSEAGRELALAIDRYKVTHHRRYLTCDEMLRVLTDLGYAKQSD